MTVLGGHVPRSFSSDFLHAKKFEDRQEVG
jgi:hypothetical protein